MKNLLQTVRSISQWLVLGTLAVLTVGCEVDSANRRLEITPNSAELRPGQSVTLNAHNGYVYDWSLEDPSLGTLNTRSGQQVVYTSLASSGYRPSTNSANANLVAIQVVTVTSTFTDRSEPDSGSADTNAPAPSIHKAEAYISHIIDPVEPSD